MIRFSVTLPVELCLSIKIEFMSNSENDTNGTSLESDALIDMNHMVIGTDRSMQKYVGHKEVV